MGIDSQLTVNYLVGDSGHWINWVLSIYIIQRHQLSTLHGSALCLQNMLFCHIYKIWSWQDDRSPNLCQYWQNRSQWPPLWFTTQKTRKKTLKASNSVMKNCTGWAQFVSEPYFLYYNPIILFVHVHRSRIIKIQEIYFFIEKKN